MKRLVGLIAILLCLAALLSLFAACGKKKGKTPETQRGGEPQTQTADGADETQQSAEEPKRPSANGDLDPSGEGLTYTEKSDGTYEVTGFREEYLHSAVEIPDTYRGKAVTSVGDRVFYNCAELRSVTFGANVTVIGASAFEKCDALNAITIGAGVTVIGAGAFRDCTEAKTITIPQSVTSIGADAFRGCLGLMSLSYLGSLEQWRAISRGEGWNTDAGYDMFYCDNGDSTYTRAESES